MAKPILVRLDDLWEPKFAVHSNQFSQNDHVNKLLSSLEYWMIIMIMEKVLQCMMYDKSTAFIKRNRQRTVTHTHL